MWPFNDNHSESEDDNSNVRWPWADNNRHDGRGREPGEVLCNCFKNAF